MAYIHKDSPIKTNGQPNVNFGSQVIDSNRIAIQGVASGISTVDATATPLVSPITLSATTTTLTVPANAISLTIIASTAAASVSEDPAFASSVSVPANTSLTLNMARQKFVYLRGTTATSFLFSIID